MIDQGAAELEVSLHRRDGLGWTTEVRVNDPAIDELKTSEGNIDLDLQQLEALEADTAGYAQYLTQALFADEVVSSGLAEARRAATRARRSLRVRLRVGRSAPDLHRVRWELLRDPDRLDASLATQESVVFSRYLESRDYRHVEIRPGEALQALVAVAGPPEDSLEPYEIDERSFAPVDVQGEIARAEKALVGSEVTTLGGKEPVTLERLIEGLRAGPDILYLVCHGYVKTSGQDRGPRLLLQGEDGKATHVDGRELVTRMRELTELPRLVVLASCMSASSMTADAGALAAVGPELAAIGVPAVLAMQDNVTMETVEKMMPVFFARLREQPEIDRALAIARATLQDRPDWWVPVLFMRLKSGRVWYQPGFAGGVDHWSMLLDQIEAGNLTPVLGPGLNDQIIGSRRELARSWAQDKKIPIPSPRDEDLPQVAQYIAKLWDENYLRLSLRKALGSRLLDNFRPALTQKLGDEAFGRLEERVTRKGAGDPEALLELVSTVGRIRRDDDPYEPYKILASLGLPLYVTTEPSGLLADAIAGPERKPVSESFRWTDREGVWERMSLEKPAATRGSEQEPLLFSLFGDLRIPGSVVLSEDDYFEFLTTFSDSSTRRELIPSQVVEALVHRPLLLVGFRIDDWDFRVLFRAIRSLQGARASHSSGVAVQLDPEASSQQDAERVKGYFQKYFQQDFNIYWGSTATFLRELAVRKEARQ
jgi:CHAT domain/SIR2-like domain